jgi:thiamine-phosphate pyrophosphorylase
LLRVLDVNRNRALEALRVVEDQARFARRSPALARRAKQLRHQLREALESPLGGALTARDVTGDPGNPADPEAPPEAARPDAAGVLPANLNRAKESLRSLEEHLKPLDDAAAAAVSRLRYACYDLEQALLVARPSLEGRQLYVILQRASGRPDLTEQARLVLSGGARLLQLREKQLPDGALLDQLREVRALAEAADALLVVNDRPDLALLAGAQGVHVGQDDLPPAAARQVLGPTGLVGASAHSPAEVQRALAGHPDYLGFGTLFSSPTKPDLSAQGLGALRELAAECPLPIYGIGGVMLEHVAAVIDAGAFGVAVSSAVLDAPDPAAATAELVSALAAARGGVS